MVNAIIISIVLCYLAIGLIIGFIGRLWLMFSDCGDRDAVVFLLGTSVLWPVLILTIVIKFIISIPKAIKEYVIFLAQLLIK